MPTALHSLASVEGLYHFFHLSNAVAPFLHFFEKFQHHAGLLRTENGAGMALVDGFVAQSQLHRGGKFEETQGVGHRGPPLPHFLAQFLLREVVLLDELLVSQRHLNGVEVFALDILHQRHLHHIFIVGGADVGGNCCETCQF